VTERLSPGSRQSRRGRVFLVFNAWLLWLIVLAFAAALFWHGHAQGLAKPGGMQYAMWSVAALLLLPYVPLRALAGWRCRLAARRLPEGWRGGNLQLPGWPGVSDRDGEVRLRCGSGAFRLWVLAGGVALSGCLMHRLGRGVETLTPLDFVLSLAPAVCALFGSLLWGKGGWQLSVDSARSQAMLTLWRALRRNYHSSAGLPTIQGVELAGGRGAGYRKIVIRRAKGQDWKLGLPGTWTPELAEALGARLAGLAGVEFETPPPQPTPRAQAGNDAAPQPGSGPEAPEGARAGSVAGSEETAGQEEVPE